MPGPAHGTRRMHLVERFSTQEHADRSWMHKAACRGHDPEMWFPETIADEPDAQYAESICHHCPVQADCDHYADTLDEKYGIWGGIRQRQRRARRKARNA